MRKVWNPPLVVSGKKASSPQFDVYFTHWPKDHSPLSAKKITLYFDQKQPDFLFPYWIEIADGSLRFNLRVTDSGRALQTPAFVFPK